MFEKGYSEECAEYMAQRLIDSLTTCSMAMPYCLSQTRHNLQNGEATLIPYESFFHRFYEMERIESTVVYWDVESQAWRSFQLENLLDWSPVC